MFRESFLLIYGLFAWSASSLKCYFCKSDYITINSEDVLKTADIPYCGPEPYDATETHVLDCDAYWDNYSMVKPSFKNATKSLTTKETYRRNQSKDVDPVTAQYHHHSAVREVNGNGGFHKEDERKRSHGPGEDDSNIESEKTPTQQKFRTSKPHSDKFEKNATGSEYISNMDNEWRKHLKHIKHKPTKNIYPYNITGGPWSIQSVHNRVKPQYCLTIETRGASYPNRVCGLRYYMDCPLLIQLTSEPLEPSYFITHCHQCNTDYCNKGEQTTYISSQAVLFLSLISLL